MNSFLEPPCATVFQGFNYGGWGHDLLETDHGSLFGTDRDHDVSSVKVREGCTLEGFDDKDLESWIFSFNADQPEINDVLVNDKLTSYSCKCSKNRFPYQN